MSLLDKINGPEEIKKMNIDELNTLSGEIRRFLINNISSTGGHLASNLGVVELTIALNKVFNFSEDRIIFDVGHQSYVHKIITGRCKEFSTLRKFGGLSGFPKVEESKYDAFDTGHASNSLSIAAGMKRGYLKKKDNRNVVAVIGDGSFGGGMVYEAMNDIGHYGRENIIVILNDNGMSISKNKSSISDYLSKLRTSSKYLSAKTKLKNKLSSQPRLSEIIRSSKNRIKHFIMGDTIFDNLGFKYYGPYDGHNISELVRVFSNIKGISRPVIIHVKTTKGKGYQFAESNPEKFHGISEFDISTGANSKNKDYSAAFGKYLIKEAESNPDVVAVTAAMPSGTGLSEFATRFPDRFYDVGICEQHAVTMCGGMAAAGIIPVFAVYSTFMQRAYDQLFEDVALMGLHAVFCIDRAGIVGSDGETHQGIFDLSYLRTIPKFTVMAPVSFEELGKMLHFALNDMNSPVAIRYPRGNVQYINNDISEIEYGKAEIILSGNDISLFACGSMVKTACEISEILAESGISCEIINLRFIKPLDEEALRKSVLKTKKAVILEDNIKAGGVGEAIISVLAGEAVKLFSVSFPDCFVEHGSPDELYKKYRMDSSSAAEDIKKEFNL